MEKITEKREKLSIIVPCYNERDALPYFYSEITSVLMGLDSDYEIIFVDDGSRDDTIAFLKGLAEQNPHVFFLSFSRNFGKEAAMYAGFCNVEEGTDYVVVMDADLQDPPSLLPQMLELLRGDNFDSVATRRISRAGEPLLRSFFARGFYRIINRISDADIMEGARDFRMMKKKMVDAIVVMSEYNRFSKGIFGWVGFKTYWLPYENIERVAGNTKWNFLKLVEYAFDGIINFSQAPLAISSCCGILMTMIAFMFSIYIVCRKLIYGNPVDGWASLACIILFIGGMQFLCIGVMGQYISKIYMETKHRPHYIISETNRDEVR